MRHSSSHPITNHPGSISRHRWQSEASIAAGGEPEFDVHKALADIATLAPFSGSEKARFASFFTDDIVDGVHTDRVYWRKALDALRQQASAFELKPQAFNGDVKDIAHIIQVLEENLGPAAARPQGQNRVLAEAGAAPRP